MVYILTNNDFVRQGKRPSFEDMLAGPRSENEFTPAITRRRNSTRTLCLPESDVEAWMKANEKEARRRIQEMGRLRALTASMKQEYVEKESEPVYIRRAIPKRNGTYRILNEPEERLKKQQRIAAKHIMRAVGGCGHAAAFGFVKKRNVVDAIKKHQSAGSRFFLKLDLKDFFGSMQPVFLWRMMLQVFPFSQLINSVTHAPMVAPTLSVRAIMPYMTQEFWFGFFYAYTEEFILPQGAPTSPILTNIAMIPFDYNVSIWARDCGLTYTRYADDMLFSSFKKFDKRCVIKHLEMILEETPLRINYDKTRFGTNYGSNWNLGVMLNQENEITIGWRAKKDLKAAIHKLCTTKQINPEELAHLQGIISWYKSVEPESIDRLLDKWSEKYDISISTLLNTGIFSPRF